MLYAIIDERAAVVKRNRPDREGSVRLNFVGLPPAFVMLSEAKHLGPEGNGTPIAIHRDWDPNHRLFSRSAQILRYRSG